MALAAEVHIGSLILDQHSVLGPRVRLVAGQAVHRSYRLGLDVGDVRDRVTLGRMSRTVLQRQNRNVARREVVFRQPDLAIEDRDQVLRLKLVGAAIRAVALEAERIHAGAAQ